MHSALNLTTPALLFPAVSLLLLAYTNRFLGLASIIRNLYEEYRDSRDPKILRQIGNLRTRITLIKWMQFMGIGSLFLCAVAMFQIYTGWQAWGELTFGVSLLCMIASLAVSLLELVRSSDALNILLSDLQAEYDRQR
ncbi:DUF2721 domain-containing protein [Chromobacterium sp. ATCC 53434]|uniref:DUF2721 domain-containing protein n=1 Tax=Chromobacterium TaxID=535 RepID=UPI000C78D028|nr:DUF2721 domain-containing protein [Chromobacterium sp. ATCC 53434]AUH50071.1 DUF2721 domain-containing protein [Chromobacterium sp. ATCC 53434]